MFLSYVAVCMLLNIWERTCSDALPHLADRTGRVARRRLRLLVGLAFLLFYASAFSPKKRGNPEATMNYFLLVFFNCLHACNTKRFNTRGKYVTYR